MSSWDSCLDLAACGGLLLSWGPTGYVSSATTSQFWANRNQAIWRMSAILLGKPVSAAEAKAIGLVTDVFATDEVVSHTLEVALTLASVSFASWCLAKTVVARGKHGVKCSLDGAY